MAKLVSVADYKTYAGISGTGDDTVIDVLIDIASASVRRYCGRNESNGFESLARTETYDGNGGPFIQLREWPVASIDSIVERFDDGSTTTLESSDYRVEARTGLLYRLGAASGRFPTDAFGELVGNTQFGYAPCWTPGFLNFSITYTGGYSAIPDDLKFIVYRLVDWMYAERRRNPGMQSESLGAYSYTRMSMSDDGDAAMLRRACAMYRTGGLA